MYDENEPVLFRAVAAFWVASPLFPATDLFNISSLAERVREALDIVAASPKEDENRIAVSGRFMFEFVREHVGPACHNITVKQILDAIAEKLRLYLSVTESNSVTAENSELLNERARAGGKKCDCCGKTLEELQLEFFFRCDRCEILFFLQLRMSESGLEVQGTQTCLSKTGTDCGRRRYATSR
jgi:hypothetical protein